MKSNHEVDSRLMDILDSVSARAEKEPVLLDEITQEVEIVRSKNYEQH
jgi:hypothetical protein